MESSIYGSFVVVVAAGSLLASMAFAEDAGLPDAESILEKVEAKIGDTKARKAMRGLVMKGSVEAAGMPGKGSFEEAFLGDDCAKLTVEFPGMGVMTQGTNGRFSWSTDPAMGVTVREGSEQASVQRLFAISRRAHWRSLYARASTAGRAQIEGRGHFELLMTPEQGDAERWFVDAERHVVSRVDLALPDPMGGRMAMQFHYSDWKPVKGILFPHVKVQKVGEMAITYRYESVSPGAEVTPERVAAPKEVAEARTDPKKRTPTAPATGGECTLETAKAQHVASIRVTISASEVSETLAVILPEVFTYLGKVGATPAGPPFSRYHKIEGSRIDLEAGIPVRSAVKGEGRIQASELPAGRVAATWHVGPYHALPQTYDVLKSWMARQSLESAGGFWEIYWTDPGLEPDPAKWRTQILWPVK
jgi:effector-binding domain-containing protein